MEDAFLGFVCLGIPLFVAVMILWFEAVVRQYPANLSTAADIRKKKIMETAAERKKEDCPLCNGWTKYRLALHGGEEQYLFFCNRCKLHFKYSYWSQLDDYRKYLIIDALCPKCKKIHKPAIVGDLDTDRIPCEPCWDKSQDEPLQIPPAKNWPKRKRKFWQPWVV